MTIPSDFGLDGHSDADILLHAVTDALLGAAALGDIGMHFPDTDPQWKGAASAKFLEHACGLVQQAGFTLVNVDTTVILEKPKLKDYRAGDSRIAGAHAGAAARSRVGEIQDRGRRGAGGRRTIGRGAGDRDHRALSAASRKFKSSAPVCP